MITTGFCRISPQTSSDQALRRFGRPRTWLRLAARVPQLAAQVPQPARVPQLARVAELGAVDVHHAAAPRPHPDLDALAGRSAAERGLEGAPAAEEPRSE